MRVVGNKRYTKNAALLFISIILATTAALGGFYLYQTRSADTAKAVGQGGLTFQQYATHPYAINIPGKQRIHDMEVTEDGELIAGYGDWDGNIDSLGNASQRVGVVPLNLQTGEWGDIFYAGTEAIDVIRKIDGKLYIPTTDPSNKAATGNPSGNLSGYVTNATGNWTFVDNGKADVHTFDVAKRVDGELWTVGNNENPAPRGAVAWRSTDNGTTWGLGRDGPEGMEVRYYWLASLDNNMYTFEMFSGEGLLKFDGSTWSQRLDYSCQTYEAKLVQVFDGKILCGTGFYGNIDATDGETNSTVTITGANQFTNTTARVKDYYQTDSHLYALTESGIFRTTSFDTPWERLGFDDQVANSESIAVYEDSVYLGKSDGTIWKSQQTITDAAAVSVEFEDCAVFDTASGTVTSYNSWPALCPNDVVIPSTIDGTPVTSIGANAFAGQNLTSVVIPEGVTTIQANAFGEFDGAQNMIHTVTLPSTLKSIGAWSFSGNAITTIDLPTGLESLESNAFYNNRISSLAIPASVTSIGNAAFEYNNLTEITITGNPTLGDNAFRFNGLDRNTIPNDIPMHAAPYYEYYEQNANFVRIHSTNIAFLTGKSDILYTTAQALDYETIDEEAMTWRAIYSSQRIVGGILFSPASVSVSHVNADNSPIAPQQTHTGAGDGLTNYRVQAALPYITKNATPTTDDAGNEDTLFDASFSNTDTYYRVGQTITVSPSEISHYITPSNRSVTLSAITNPISFTYLTRPQINDGMTVNPDGTITPGAPNTGIVSKSLPILAAVLGMLLITLIGMVVKKHGSKRV